jgi:hypothetical protein
MTPLESARWWLNAGFHPIPIPHRQKRPVLENWPALRLTETELAHHFNEQSQNVGIILGDEHGAADVDLDCVESVAAAALLLPETHLIFGRPSKRASHYIYRIDPPIPSLKLTDPTRPKDTATIIELRCTKKDGSVGFQTVVPDSTHESGEHIRFDGAGHRLATNIDARVLSSAVMRVGAAALFARHWPGQNGGRHDAFLSLAGALARAQWKEQEAIAFLFAIYHILWGAQADHAACASEVQTTFAKHAANGEATGIPKLKELVKEKAVDAALRWLGLEHRVETGLTSSESMFAHLAPYPKPPSEEAFYGIAGKFVRMVEPHTEADRSVLLILFLVAAGNVLGRNAFVWAGGDKHYGNLFAAVVGPTATGRKGSATSVMRMVFEGIDPSWAKKIQGGLSSGEGLISMVQDAVYRREKVPSEDGKTAAFKEVCTDCGVLDKRLLVNQSEFFGALQAMKRQGNTLSSTIRDAWDRGDLNTIVKHNPASATGAHVSIIANITREELLRAMLAEEIDNGFANRFLWACSKRSKELPEGGKMREVNFEPLQSEFNRIRGKVTGAIERDGDANDLWGYDDKPGVGAYHRLTQERTGLFGAATARAASQVLRLSLIYAQLDASQYIRKEHLLAALEVWRYCEESAAFIFGDASGDPIADTIIVALRGEPNGLTRTEINNRILGRHRASAEIDRALLLLHRTGRARFEKEPTGGRPTERWFAMDSEGI